MSLLDELKGLLTSHLRHVKAQPNSGTARLIEDHLKQLENGTDDDAHKVLGELYGALNAPVAEAPDEKPASGAAKASAKKTAAAAQTGKA